MRAKLKLPPAARVIGLHSRSAFYGLPDPLRDRRRRFVDSERDRPFEAPRPCDDNPDGAARRRWTAAATAASMRSRRAAEIPFQADAVGGRECGHLRKPPGLGASLDGEARAVRRAAIKAEEGPQSTIRRASTSVTGSGN